MSLVAAPVRTPAQPGPGPTPEALLKALDLTLARRIRGMFPGDHRALERGGGLELAALRPYEPGDDVRSIDWNATARTGITHVQVHVPERAVTAWVLLDLSPSMAFGTADRRKADVAEGVALAVGHLTAQRGNRVGAVTFGGPDDLRLPPAAGRKGLLRLLAAARRPIAIDASRATGATSPAKALEFVGRVGQARGLVVLVSDFRGPRDWSVALATAARRHEVIAVEIQDPRESELPDLGELTLIDPETGRQVRADTSSRRLRERFASAAAAERASLAADLARAGVRHIVLSTSGSWLRDFAGQLRLLGIRP
jgi:uncharacterized protein (DUF58 family)